MNLWQVCGQDLKEVSRERLNDESRLEDWVAKDSSILGMDVLIIGRQVITTSGGRIDLLAMDSKSNPVVLELKRDKTPREIVAQVLDYASWVKDLSYEQLDAIAKGFTGKPLAEAFEEHFGFRIAETVNASHSMVILASELDDSSERIVEYLSEQHGVPINVLFFTFFKGSSEFLGRAWLRDPEQMQERAQARKQAPWSGFYFVNVGESEHRNWDDCQKYAFISAGQGQKAANAIKKLKPGDRVFAYLNGQGYVGFGTVRQPAVTVSEFVPDGQNKRLLELPLAQPGMSANKDDPALCEWVVGMVWQRTVERDDAKRFKGVFAARNIVCQLRHAETVEFLRREFSVMD